MWGMSAPTELLSDPLPREPLTLAAAWLAQAFQERRTPNPNAMTLATSTAEGVPSARVVLCKDVVPDPGYVVFYTNYHSRKGRELEENARAAAVLHFDAQHRQVRIEGTVERAPNADSDAYFASRALESRIGAWASEQSEPLRSRALLLAAVETAAKRFGVSAAAGEPKVPRPPHWGGYRLWAQAVELWVEGAGRIHDRARWSRPLARHADGRLEAGAWSATRLQP
jgi:pyridoxamine 5'-phosphate oxidase